VQVALDTGADLKLHPNQIIAIPASEYPLPAPRPMNSRMARTALDALMDQILKNIDDVTKSQQWQQSWQEQVTHYVRDLVKHHPI
jgi:dTDP-4-dehydrorhamnose reductase